MRPNLLLPLLLVTLFAQGCAAPLVVGAAAGGASVANDRRSATQMLTDQDIEMRAAEAFARDAQLASAAHINTTSFNGFVLLSGEVPDEAAHNRAVSLVQGLEGVRRIHDALVNGPASSTDARSSDTWITSNVKGRLIATKTVPGSHIKVITESGVVYLMGLVSREEGKLAAAVARRIRGVTKVVKLFEYTD